MGSNDETRVPKVGLVVVASRVESGGERAEALHREAVHQLSAAGVRVVAPGATVWDAADAQRAVNDLRDAELDLLVILHCTWVVDSLQFQLVRSIRAPVLLWALPYPETYSFACVQHFASVLWHNDLHYRWVYGLPNEDGPIATISQTAHTAMVAGQYRTTNVGLVGPRPTWRVAGPQDMTYDEWDIASTLGVNVLHIQMEDLLTRAADKTDTQAAEVLTAIEKAGRIGRVEVGNDRLLHSARMYLAAKEMIEEYDIAGLTVECYPNYGGLVNLSASWLADEGIVLDSEGDIGHTVLSSLLLALNPGPVALAEIVTWDREKELLYLRHEGSSAHSLAEDPALVHIVPTGEAVGTIVEFPMKPLSPVTVTSLCGHEGDYKMFVGKVATERIAPDLWQNLGRGFLVAVKAEKGIEALLNMAFSHGMDHHWLLKEGDLTWQLEYLCGLWGIEKVSLT